MRVGTWPATPGGPSWGEGELTAARGAGVSIVTTQYERLQRFQVCVRLIRQVEIDTSRYDVYDFGTRYARGGGFGACGGKRKRALVGMVQGRAGQPRVCAQTDAPSRFSHRLLRVQLFLALLSALFSFQIVHISCGLFLLFSRFSSRSALFSLLSSSLSPLLFAPLSLPPPCCPHSPHSSSSCRNSKELGRHHRSSQHPDHAAERQLVRNGH